jgi:hypothetical protein
MTPSATRILSVTVLTPRVCVSPPDIFCTVNAHNPVLWALPVISNHTRRKNAKQRAGKITDLLLDAEKRLAEKENSNICTNSLKFVSFSEHIVTGNRRKMRNAQ